MPRDMGDGADTDADTETGLPASIEAAWGLRQRPAKGPRRGLNLRRIVAAAVRVAASEGLAAVSMGRVAKELGASPMSLYRYVQSKDELLMLMIDAAVDAPPAPPTPGEDWRAALSRWAWSYRAVLRQHPWVLRIPMSGPPVTPNNIRWLEQGLQCLHGTGLPEDAKVGVILLLGGFVRSEATLSADITAALASGVTEQEMVVGYGRLLARLTDPERFPAVRAVIEAGVFEGEGDPDEDFVFGLDRLLDGVGALVEGSSDG